MINVHLNTDGTFSLPLNGREIKLNINDFNPSDLEPFFVF